MSGSQTPSHPSSRVHGAEPVEQSPAPLGPGSVLVVDDFYAQADALREVFDERHRDPRDVHPWRFVWDYWHQPGQYTLLRTPADQYFPPEEFEAFRSALLEWGRRTLGCADISPVWLSCYVEGCRQELHADVPHGPWAFVYSLTPAGRRFGGGHTEVLHPDVLRWWSRFSSLDGVEKPQLVRDFAPDYNRLIVFDPRVPHGVSPVQGVHDPREGRLVIHGWFTDPRPVCEGALSARQVARPVRKLIDGLGPVLERFPRVHGVVSLRAAIESDGGVSSVCLLTHTLVSLSGHEQPIDELIAALEQGLRAARFPKAAGPSILTLPMLFREDDPSEAGK